ncbi:hypothetical protein ACFYY8_14245 [Streptosporangium sp. NPDC001559]|uniref:hypothetical protein n=1 Tax=Streptosporangium sp. NPDC001559 TaxID=3366187 RepID=UPI0036E4C332
MSETTVRRNGQGGPPLGVLGVVFTVLFLAGIIVSTIMAGGATFPSPFGDGVVDYFRENGNAVAVTGFLQFAASVPLAVYAATASARLHNLGVRAPGAVIALTGGALASVMLTMSALFSWALSRPQVVAEPGVVRALHFLAFATGGVGHVVFLGLLIAGVAVPGWLAGLLPRPFALTGLVIAVVAELTTLVIPLTGLAVLLPVARFGGMAWLVAAGFLLPRTRTRGNGRSTVTKETP